MGPTLSYQSLRFPDCLLPCVNSGSEAARGGHASDICIHEHGALTFILLGFNVLCLVLSTCDLPAAIVIFNRHCR